MIYTYEPRESVKEVSPRRFMSDGKHNDKKGALCGNPYPEAREHKKGTVPLTLRADSRRVLP